jgi:hypothetical protein
MSYTGVAFPQTLIAFYSISQLATNSWGERKKDLSENLEKSMGRQQKKANSKYGFLFPIGLDMGVAIGAVIHYVGAGLALGAAIGRFLA